MKITDDEFAARRDAFAAALAERGLAGAVLFDTQYVHYYTGFFFIPTERPIAFALAADGTRRDARPAAGARACRANTAVSEVAHYDEYPGGAPPDGGRCAELLDVLRIRGAPHGKLGAERGRLSVGVRLPRARPGRADARPLADVVEDQTAMKSAAEIELLRERRASGRTSRTRCCSATRVPRSPRPKSAPPIDGGERRPCSMRSGRSTAHSRPITPARSPATAGRSAATRRSARARQQHRLPGRRRARHRRVGARLGLPLGARADDGHRPALGRAEALVRPHARAADTRDRDDPPGRSVRGGRSRCARLLRRARSLGELAPPRRPRDRPCATTKARSSIAATRRRSGRGWCSPSSPGLLATVGGFRHSDTIAVTDDGVEWLTYYPRDLESLTLPAG